MTGDIDIMCGSLDFQGQPQLVKVPMLRVSHVVVAGKSHPLARRGVVTARELARYPWLVLADDLVGIGGIGAYFAANGVTLPTIAIESTSFGMMKILEEDDFLAHFAERLLPDAEKFGLTRIQHEGTFWETEVGVAYRSTTSPVKLITSFVSMLKVALTAKPPAGVASAAAAPVTRAADREMPLRLSSRSRGTRQVISKTE
jgi:DNA-binding transcriptional LysR family regulator